MNTKNKFQKEHTLAVKGVAILLMLWHHLFTFPDRIVAGSYHSYFSFRDNTIEFWIGHFGYLCVAIFMIMSGYSTYIGLTKNNNTQEFISNKCMKLFKCYWLVFIIFIPLGYLMGIRNNYSIYELINNFFCLSYSYNGEWWFASTFLLFTILSPYISKIVGTSTDNILLDFSKIISLKLCIQYILPCFIEYQIFDNFRSSTYFNLFYLSAQHLPEFLIGMLCSKYNLFEKLNAWLDNRFSYSIRLVFGIIVVYCIFLYRFSIGSSIDYLFGVLVIWLFSYFIMQYMHLKKVFIFFGRKSTFMWLTHTFFCYYYFQRYIYFINNPIFIFIELILISLFTAIVLEKILLFIDSRLFKGNSFPFQLFSASYDEIKP